MSNYEVLKLDNQLCFPLYAASRRVVGLYTPFLKPLGLTYTQYLVFLVLSEKQQMSVGEICKRLFLDSGTLTPLLKALESKGYIRRQRSTEDERTVIVSLTESGTALLDELAVIPQEIGKCIPLDTEKAQKLYELLHELLEEI